MIIPVVITVYADRSFSFITKTPPAAVLLKKACNLKTASAAPNKTKVAKISKAKIQEIAELKMPDFRYLVTLCENQYLDGLSCSVRKHDSAADLLLCVTSVTACSDMNLNCLIKLRIRSLVL